MYCQNNQLTSVRAIGRSIGGSGSYYVGADLSNNSLNAAALDQFYTDLAANAGHIKVDGNPGVSSDDPSIATAKGYTVYGT